MTAVLRRSIGRLSAEKRGATLIEFAMVAPVLLVVIMGLLDFTYRLYATAMLQGEIQKAARDGTLESSITSASQLAALDTRVKNGFRSINGQVTDSDFTFTRRNFMKNADAADAEPAETPSGICQANVFFSDTNNNGQQDDGGVEGQGGASDITLYTARVRYRSLFPLNTLYGGDAYQTITASTMLRNQPFTEQPARNAPTRRPCP